MKKNAASSSGGGRRQRFDVAQTVTWAIVAYVLTWIVAASRRDDQPLMRRQEGLSATAIVSMLAQCTESQRCDQAFERPFASSIDIGKAEIVHWPLTSSSILGEIVESSPVRSIHPPADDEPRRAVSFEDEVGRAVSNSLRDGSSEVLFTVVDSSYADMLLDVEASVRSFSPSLFFVSLHRGTASTARRLGLRVALLESKTSSKKELIYLGKYYTAMLLCASKVRFFFFEMDVWFLDRGSTSVLDVFRAAAFSTQVEDVSAAWALHTDNPYQINAGLYYVRPEVSDAPFQLFAALLEYSRRHPSVFDQGLLNCILKRGVSSRELNFILDRNNCDDAKIDLSDPSLSRLVPFNWTLVDAAVAVSHATPFIAADTLAVHILTTRPLTSSAGKKVVAKELMLWKGEGDCYYCIGGDSSQFLALDGTLVTSDGTDDFEYIGRILKELVILSKLTNRVLVLPSVSHYGRRFPSWELVDTSLLDGRWRETSFLRNPRLRVSNSAKIARLTLPSTSSRVVGVEILTGTVNTDVVWYHHKTSTTRLQLALNAARANPVVNSADVLFISIDATRDRVITKDKEVQHEATREESWLQELVVAKVKICEYVHRERRKASLVAAHMDCGTQLATIEAKALTSLARQANRCNATMVSKNELLSRRNLSYTFAEALRAQLSRHIEIDTPTRERRNDFFGPIPQGPLSKFIYSSWTPTVDTALVQSAVAR